jgi:hypothetical protein
MVIHYEYHRTKRRGPIHTTNAHYYPSYYKIISTPYIRTTDIVCPLHVSHTYTVPKLNMPTANAMAG